MQTETFTGLTCSYIAILFHLHSSWEWCKFTHLPSEKFCDFRFEEEPFEVKPVDCSSFAGRFEFVGDHDDDKCGVRIQGIKMEEAGQWKCALEEYNVDSEERGKDPIAEKSFDISVRDENGNINTGSDGFGVGYIVMIVVGAVAVVGAAVGGACFCKKKGGHQSVPT